MIVLGIIVYFTFALTIFYTFPGGGVQIIIEGVQLLQGGGQISLRGGAHPH